VRRLGRAADGVVVLVPCGLRRGFARYYFLARRDGDGPLASAAVAGFVLMCAAAVMELLGMLP
jgi:hypothetical protein